MQNEIKNTKIDLNDKELDIVEELRFFAEAADSAALVVTMLSGRIFEDAANEIESLKSKSVTVTDLIKAQKACEFLYWFAKEDYFNNYPDRQYDDEIVESQELAAVMSKITRHLIGNFQKGKK